MSRLKTLLRSFNRGLISPLALARMDIERVPLSADVMTNWMPRRLGSMMLRPGTQHIGSTDSNNFAQGIPFIFASDDLALIEITSNVLRVWVDDALVTRPAVAAAVLNGGFDSDLTSWTDNDLGGASAWVAGGYMGLRGDGTLAAIREQEVTLVESGVEHALNIVIAQGPMTFQVGSATSTDDYIAKTTLDTGAHSLTFTPTTNFWIEFSNAHADIHLVDSCEISAAGVMTVATPWAEADLSLVRYEQSGDIIYTATKGNPQYKIERRNTTSWSVVRYEAEDGPFEQINVGPITITPSALTGAVTLTASADLFKATDVDGLYRITSSGQRVSVTDIGVGNTWTNTIKVTGVTSQRVFTITRADRTDSTITLQRSLTSDTGPWEDVTTYTTNATITYDDTLDNQTAWYRIGVATGDWGSDAIDLTLDYSIGSIDGVARVTAYTSPTVVTGEIITAMGGTDATDDWYRGSWSDRLGYPSAVALIEGRLGWAGKAKSWLGVSDQYQSYDDNVIGDSGPITRTIGSGPVDTVNWMLALRQGVMGTDSQEHVLRSSREDEPLTPTNTSLKGFTTLGSAEVAALKIDNSGVFVEQGGSRVMKSAYGASFEYETNDLTLLFPEAGSSPIRRMAVQRKPDTRLHCIREDGTAAVLVHDPTENVTCWCMHETGDGSTYDPDAVVTDDEVDSTIASSTEVSFEDVVVLPALDGQSEDQVYYFVKRTVSGGTVRYLEKWALESEAQCGTINKVVDSHVIGTIAGGVMTGLSHLEGLDVEVWVNGKDVGAYTVSSGQITGITEDGSNACAGIGYIARFRSMKLGELTEKKNVERLGVIMRNTHYQGLKYGPSFNELDSLPVVEDATVQAADTVHSTYDKESLAFDGRWDTDSRVCLQARSPRGCTLLAAIIEMEN